MRSNILSGGEKQVFPSGAQSGLTWPNGAEVRGRKPGWYALPEYRSYPGQVFISMATGERHITKYSPEPLIADNLLSPVDGISTEVVAAVMNSFVVALFMETGMFGKSIVVDGVHLSQYDGPSCIQLDKRWSSTQCDSCEFFSPNNCLLRLDEFLLEDIKRFTEIRAEGAEAFARKRRFITKTIYKELKAHGRPLHYTVIAKIIMGRYPKFRLNAHSVYHFLRWHPELFERVDAGVYRAK